MWLRHRAGVSVETTREETLLQSDTKIKVLKQRTHKLARSVEQSRIRTLESDETTRKLNEELEAANKELEYRSVAATKLFDSRMVGSTEQALDFIGNILESSTEYSIIGKDLDGKILLWNEGARRLYGYEPKRSWALPAQPSCTLRRMRLPAYIKKYWSAPIRDGKWEGTVTRLRKNGERPYRPEW